jgi:hypothetical protein
MDEYVKVYSNNRSYINRAKYKYLLNNFQIQNEKVMLLIYTYEWFKIPKENNFEKVVYHPFLTKNDQYLIDDLRTRYILRLGLFSLAYLTISNSFFAKRFKKPKFLLFNFYNLIITGLLSYSFWNIYLYKKLNQDVGTVKDLKKYLDLNVDLQKIIQELVNYNIKLI